MDELFSFKIEKQWDYENGFNITSCVTRMAKFLAHYELYKKIVHLPGHVVECGVYKGGSLIRFATFREILESPHSRKLIGFDAFGKFPKEGLGPQDLDFVSSFEEGGDGIPRLELEKTFAHKKFTNYDLIQGDMAETVPDYIKKHPELKIALLHIDVDVYQPSIVALENFYNRIVPGGLIIFDDYGTVAGETKAVDDFFAGKSIQLQKLPISHVPAFLVV